MKRTSHLNIEKHDYGATYELSRVEPHNSPVCLPFDLSAFGCIFEILLAVNDHTASVKASTFASGATDYV